ncbi:hypothetical protein [Lentzea sp. NPDC003310]
MCFMFGASEEQVRRVLEEVRRAREDTEIDDPVGVEPTEIP